MKREKRFGEYKKESGRKGKNDIFANILKQIPQS